MVKSVSQKKISFRAAVPSINNLGLMFTYTPGYAYSTLTCLSTGSPATTVTISRNGITDVTLKNGESVVDRDSGIAYRLTQTVTDRAASTYENVLTIIDTLANIVDNIFTCRIHNMLGSSNL